jgi:hypothetical protein
MGTGPASSLVPAAIFFARAPMTWCKPMTPNASGSFACMKCEAFK